MCLRLDFGLLDYAVTVFRTLSLLVQDEQGLKGCSSAGATVVCALVDGCNESGE